MTPEEIKLAGRLIKIIELCNSPGMDAVAVKLNCGLTYEEEREAAYWGKAFELAMAAKPGDNIFDLARRLRDERIT